MFLERITPRERRRVSMENRTVDCSIASVMSFEQKIPLQQMEYQASRDEQDP